MRDSDDLQKASAFLDALITRHRAAMRVIETDLTSMGLMKGSPARAMEARIRSELISYVPTTQSDAIKKLSYLAALMIRSKGTLDDVDLKRLRDSVRAFTD